MTKDVQMGYCQLRDKKNLIVTKIINEWNKGKGQRKRKQDKVRRKSTKKQNAGKTKKYKKEQE